MTNLVDSAFQCLRRDAQEQVNFFIVQLYESIHRIHLDESDWLSVAVVLKTVLTKDTCRHGSAEVNFEAFPLTVAVIRCIPKLGCNSTMQHFPFDDG